MEELFAALVVSVVTPYVAGLAEWVREIFARRRSSDRISSAEREARENPAQPRLAWDLARVTLEEFLDRNQRQLNAIYLLTITLMAVGFTIVSAGIYVAYVTPNKEFVSIVASSSGVLISFFSGSFLLVYRSVLTQTGGYVSVLERINAVGMAIDVIGNISSDKHELRDNATAQLASQLLMLYSQLPSKSAHVHDDGVVSARRNNRRPRKKSRSDG